MANERNEYVAGTPLELDDITSEQYRAALENLRLFAAVDSRTVVSLDHLVKSMGTLYQDLRTAVIARGEIVETVTDWDLEGFDEAEKAEYADMPVGVHRYRQIRRQDERGFRLYINDPFVEMQGLKKVESSGDENIRYTFLFSGELTDTIFGKPEQPAMWYATTQISSHAMFMPLLHPDDPAHSRGFTRILQKGVKDLLPVLEEPQQLPAAFRY